MEINVYVGINIYFLITCLQLLDKKFIYFHTVKYPISISFLIH